MSDLYTAQAWISVEADSKADAITKMEMKTFEMDGIVCEDTVCLVEIDGTGSGLQEGD